MSSKHYVKKDNFLRYHSTCLEPYSKRGLYKKIKEKATETKEQLKSLRWESERECARNVQEKHSLCF